MLRTPRRKIPDWRWLLPWSSPIGSRICSPGHLQKGLKENEEWSEWMKIVWHKHTVVVFRMNKLHKAFGNISNVSISFAMASVVWLRVERLVYGNEERSSFYKDMKFFFITDKFKCDRPWRPFWKAYMTKKKTLCIRFIRRIHRELTSIHLNLPTTK